MLLLLVHSRACTHHAAPSQDALRREWEQLLRGRGQL